MENVLFCTGHEHLLKDIVRAQGCLLYDGQGNQYLDFESGTWCTVLGHCRPEISRVIKDQVDSIMHTGFCYVHPGLEKTAQTILKLLKIKNGKCVYLCSGSEAIEFGIRVSRAVSHKPYLLTLSDSYLGSYGAAHNKPGPQWVLFDWLSCRSCPRFENCDPCCSRFSEIPFEQISAFVFEPGSSSGLVRFPPQKLIHNLIYKVKAGRGLLMVNEVTTGMGRTGHWFGHQHYQIIPDIAALGKGLGNGYPVSISAVSGAVLSRLDQKSFKYAQSHQNDPLGAVVAGQVIKVLEEQKLVEQSKRLGEKLAAELTRLKEKYPLIKEVRGRGLMLALEFHEKNSRPVAYCIQTKLLQKGLIIASRPGFNVIRIDPPLTVKQSEIELFLTGLEQVLSDLHD